MFQEKMQKDTKSEQHFGLRHSCSSFHTSFFRTSLQSCCQCLVCHKLFKEVYNSSFTYF